MVPDPVDFGVLFQCSERKLKILFQYDVDIQRCTAHEGYRHWEDRSGVHGGAPLRKHATDQNIAAVVPYGVELGVDSQKLGRQIESILRVVVRSFLHSTDHTHTHEWSLKAEQSHAVVHHGMFAHLGEHIVSQLGVHLDLFALLLSTLCKYLLGRSRGSADTVLVGYIFI